MKRLRGPRLSLKSACRQASRKFRIRVIPVTLLWSLAAALFAMTIALVASLWTDVAGAHRDDFESQWPPCFSGALPAWSLPVGMDALLAGWFFLEGRWKAALLATAALLILFYLCLIPFFLVLAKNPPP